jgi:hypothetical protein
VSLAASSVAWSWPMPITVPVAVAELGKRAEIAAETVKRVAL